MATYAVLGATGNCSTALIDNLLRTEDAGTLDTKSFSMADLTPVQLIPSDIGILSFVNIGSDLLVECNRLLDKKQKEFHMFVHNTAVHNHIVHAVLAVLALEALYLVEPRFTTIANAQQATSTTFVGTFARQGMLQHSVPVLIY
ncbi:hypothetical protein EYZ11_011650 [Aspergillus tanneri]|uniref:NAD(P)-binding domain-containing protein n=1 Tax=Aspergillus tanneri TaxID=1220188 RepID=A0A4S3J2B6_9EURO|nr:hypothetical protein EYZ11_011650 [Aspergillus tanneri]